MPRRQTRTSTARNFQSREHDARDLIAQEAQGILWFDPRKVRPGYKYGWIRRAVNNEEDSYTIRTRQQSGWTPVPADRHPELTISGWGLPSETQKNYIEISGLLLCEIPERVYKRNQEAQRLMAFEATKMPNIEDLGDQSVNRNLPMFDESATTLEAVTMEKAREMFKE